MHKPQEPWAARIIRMTSDLIPEADATAKALRDSELDEEIRRIQEEEGESMDEDGWR